jgi:hypothetical protein
VEIIGSIYLIIVEITKNMSAQGRSFIVI